MNIASDVAADVISVMGVPSTALRSLLGKFIEKRMEQAFKILLEELKKGKIDENTAASEDEKISIIYRYGLAAKEGAARKNLRLLAQVICGLARNNRLYTDEFHKYANVLSLLTKDQIYIIGKYASYMETYAVEDEEYRKIRAAAWKAFVSEIIPAEYPTEQHVLYIMNQLAGLGLIIQDTVIGGIVYNLSPLFNEIRSLTNFPDGLAE